MPSPHGGDRLTPLPGGGFEVRSPLDKGWRARRPKTRTTAEFPGTAVHWDEKWFEVVGLRRFADGSRAYDLYPWRPEHAIRNPSRYDEESERSLRAEHAQREKRERNTLGIGFAGLFVGHVPSHAQTEIEREYGFSAIRLSLLSLVIPFLFVVWVATRLPIKALPPPYASGTEVAIAAYLMVESIARFLLVMKFSSPWGSVPGLIVYEIWRLTTRGGAEFEKRAAVKAVERLRTDSQMEADPATAERDAYAIRAPFLSLLSAAEQTKLRATFGFDPGTSGLTSAIIIGFFAALGVWSGFVKIVGGQATGWTWSSILVASLLLGEQAWRLMTVLGGRPAGSVLGALVRPWCRRLLMAEPEALKKGTIEPKPANLPDLWEDRDPEDHTGR
jgi:hypothetical protein